MLAVPLDWMSCAIPTCTTVASNQKYTLTPILSPTRVMIYGINLRAYTAYLGQCHEQDVDMLKAANCAKTVLRVSALFFVNWN